jgi:hypothetical protein
MGTKDSGHPLGNETIRYDRCNFSGRFAHCFQINYPADEARHWDGVVTRIGRTLANR